MTAQIDGAQREALGLVADAYGAGAALLADIRGQLIQAVVDRDLG